MRHSKQHPMDAGGIYAAGATASAVRFRIPRVEPMFVCCAYPATLFTSMIGSGGQSPWLDVGLNNTFNEATL
jgi:hypothetical protein